MRVTRPVLLAIVVWFALGCRGVQPSSGAGGAETASAPAVQDAESGASEGSGARPNASLGALPPEAAPVEPEGSVRLAAAVGVAPSAAPGDSAEGSELPAYDANGCALDIYLIAHSLLYGETEPMTTREFLSHTGERAGDVDGDDRADAFWESHAGCGSAGCTQFVWLTGDGCASVHRLGNAVSLETLTAQAHGHRSIRATTADGAENSTERELEFDGRNYVAVRQRSCGYGFGDPDLGTRCDEWTEIGAR